MTQRRDFNPPEPKYLSIKRQILEDLARGAYGRTTPVPTEQQLAKSLIAAPMTIRRALLELVEEGLLVRQRGRGRGTYLRQGTDLSNTKLRSRRPLKNLAVIHQSDLAALQRDPVYFLTLLEIQAECARLGIALMLHTDVTPGQHLLASRLAETECQAAVALGGTNLIELLAVEAHGIPVIVAGPYHETAPLSFVAHNDFQGAFATVQHLLELGHTSIAMINSHKESKVTIDRREGWRAALRASPSAHRSSYFLIGNRREGEGDALDQLFEELCVEFKKRAPPSALFARDGFFARAAILALKKVGLDCPRQISVACVGSFYEGLPDLPTVTRAVSSQGALGRSVVQLAIDLISGRQTGPIGLNLPMYVVEGQTTQSVQKKYRPSA